MQDVPTQYTRDRALRALTVSVESRQIAAAPGPAEFGALADAFSHTGGLLEADELAVRIAFGNGVGIVARWIVKRHAVNLNWQNRYWLPAFQFTRPAMQLCESLGTVLDELAPVLDDWDVADWFASSNVWLQGRTPASALTCSPRDVLDAARACRFSIRG